ncbi:MAG: carboxymuconolactone decarboxylase family protein [Candidatus Korobacteraceae bacterium]
MARIQLTPLTEMTPEQRSVYDEAAGGLRGHAPAPMTAWLQNAELARRAQKLGELVRYQTSLPPRLSEFAILVVARHWTAHFEWQAHKKEALKAGINPEAIAMIASRRRPVFENDAQRVVYDISNSLLETKFVADDLYQDGVRALGEKGVVELVAILGYYSLVAMTLNAFEIGLPDSLQPELLGEPDGNVK